jgi:hypothetical protein
MACRCTSEQMFKQCLVGAHGITQISPGACRITNTAPAGASMLRHHLDEILLHLAIKLRQCLKQWEFRNACSAGSLTPLVLGCTGGMSLSLITGRATEASFVQAGLLGVSIAGELLRRSSTQLRGQLPGSPLPAAAAETTARPLPTPPSAQSRSGDGSSARTSQEATGATSPGE